MKRIAGVTAFGAAILLAGMAGCSDDKNPVRSPHQGATYLPSSTPQNVLANLRTAYMRRDSTAYDSLFDASYVGTSIDNLDPTPALLTFAKSDEAMHISALARRPSIVSVYLDFGSSLVRYSDGGDPPGWATIQSTTMVLEINDFSSSYTLVSNNELNEFKFAPTTPSTGSPTDTTWHIVRWTEIHQ